MATSEVQTVSSAGDKMRLALSGALVIAALVAFYLLADKGGLVQWAGLIVGLAAAAGVFFTSESGRQLVAFGRDAVREVKKWFGLSAKKPCRSPLMSSPLWW